MTLQKPSGQHIKLALIILVGAAITLVASPIYYYVRSRSFLPNPIFLTNRFTSSFFLERTLTWHSKLVYSLAISPDGKTLASGSSDNTMTLWNLATGEQIRTLASLREAAPTERYANTRHYNPVESLAISPDGKTLVSGSYDKTIKIWRLE